MTGDVSKAHAITPGHVPGLDAVVKRVADPLLAPLAAGVERVERELKRQRRQAHRIRQRLDALDELHGPPHAMVHEAPPFRVTPAAPQLRLGG